MRFTTLVSIALLFAGGAAAQETDVALSGIRTDSKLPVEVTSDSLAVNQTDGTAIFTGNVVVVQGDMRLTAPEMTVIYEPGGTNRVDEIRATGGVTLITPTEAAESADANYTVASGVVVMTGDVLLTQGQNAIAGQKLTVNLDDGTGRMEGRVTTILQPGSN